MKQIFLMLTLFASAATAYAQSPTWVNGYTNSAGQYVEGHFRTTPNQTRNDNYSTRPNVNPFTNEVGTKPRDEDVLNKLLREQSLQTPTINYPAYNTAPSLPSYPTYPTYSTPVYTAPTTNYVGPRGGVYHLSPSGRKVYN